MLWTVSSDNGLSSFPYNKHANCVCRASSRDINSFENVNPGITPFCFNQKIEQNDSEKGNANFQADQNNSEQEPETLQTEQKDVEKDLEKKETVIS